MSNYHKTEIILLKKYAFKESSYICKAISKDFGLISIIFKGAKRRKSKFLGLINTASYLDIELYKKESSNFFIGIDCLLKENFLFCSHYREIIFINAALEIYLQLEDTYENKLFNLLYNYIKVQKETRKPQFLIFCRFILALYKILGIHLNLKTCSLCNKILAEEKEIIYSPREKGFVCSNCEQNFTFFKSKDIFLKINNINNFADDFTIKNEEIKEICTLFLIHFKENYHKNFYLKSLEYFF